MSFSLEDFIPSLMVEEVKYAAKDRIVINSTTLQIGRDERHIKGTNKADGPATFSRQRNTFRKCLCVGGVESDDGGRVTGAETP